MEGIPWVVSGSLHSEESVEGANDKCAIGATQHAVKHAMIDAFVDDVLDTASILRRTDAPALKFAPIVDEGGCPESGDSATI